MALVGEIGWIGKHCPDHHTRLVGKCLRSNAGWFIGTICDLCALEDPSPFSRESGYYASKEDLIDSLRTNSCRWRDADFHGLVDDAFLKE